MAQTSFTAQTQIHALCIMTLVWGRLQASGALLQLKLTGLQRSDVIMMYYSMT